MTKVLLAAFKLSSWLDAAGSMLLARCCWLDAAG
jgi:hypothetical protein